MEYNKDYTPYTRQEIIEKVKANMSQKRFQHVLRVEEKAIDLAEKYKADKEKASLAALLHDYAKEMPNERTSDIIINYGLDLNLLNYGPSIWHGPVGAILAEEFFEISDQDILDAIFYHTVGHPKMGETSKIVYVADYIEDGRDFEGVEEARKHALSSLDEAIAFESRQSLLHLIKVNKAVYPQAIETYNEFCGQGGI